MAPTQKKAKKRSFSFLTSLLVLAIAWSALWGAAAFSTRRAIDRWAEESASKPFQVEVKNPHLSGFPLLVVWRFDAAKGKGDKGMRFEAHDVAVRVKPWAWGRLRVTGDMTIAENLPLPSQKSPVAFTADASEGDIQQEADGGFRLTRLTLLSAEVKSANEKLFKADELAFALLTAHEPAQSYRDASATLVLKARGLVLTSAEPVPLGNRIAAANAQIRIMGPLPDFGDKAEVAKWNAASGVFECDSVNLIWGPLKAELKGTLALTQSLQPEGAFSGRVIGLKQAVQSLADLGALEKRQAAALKSTLTLFAKPVQGGEPGEVEVPLTLQQNALSLGPVSFLKLPELVWD
jgi:hypothetical protein